MTCRLQYVYVNICKDVAHSQQQFTENSDHCVSVINQPIQETCMNVLQTIRALVCSLHASLRNSNFPPKTPSISFQQIRNARLQIRKLIDYYCQDSELLMEERNNQPYPPDHVFIEYGSKAPPAAFGSHNNSQRKTKRDRKKTKVCFV